MTAATLIDDAPTSLGRTSERTSIGRRNAAWEGIRDITPMVIGVIPFGLAIGATMATTSISTAEGLFGAATILAGAAQLSVITMLDDGAAPAVAILAALIINARLLLYSASAAPWFADEPLRRRLVLAIPVIDQMHFTCIPRFQQGELGPAERRAYWAGAGTFLASSFVLSQVVALAAGTRLPEWSGIEVAAPLALTGLLAKATTAGRPAIQAGVVAALVAMVGAGLPFQSSILLAIAAGIAAGLVRRPTPSAGPTPKNER